MKKHLTNQPKPSSAPRKHDRSKTAGLSGATEGERIFSRNSDGTSSQGEKTQKAFNDLEGMTKKGDVDAVVKIIDQILRRRFDTLINRHNRSLYDALAIIYRLKWLLDRFDPVRREEALRKLSIQVQGERYYHGLLEAFWPAPRGDAKARKRALNCTSRYAKALEAAEKKAVKPGRVSGLLERRGGIDGFLGIRRQRKKAGSMEAKPAGRKLNPQLNEARLGRRSVKISGKFNSPVDHQIFRIKVPRPMRKSFVVQQGLQIVLMRSDPTAHEARVEAFGPIDKSEGATVNEVIDALRLTLSRKVNAKGL